MGRRKDIGRDCMRRKEKNKIQVKRIEDRRNSCMKCRKTEVERKTEKNNENKTEGVIKGQWMRNKVMGGRR